MKRRPLSKVAEAMLETAAGMHRVGVMDDETYEKITLRHLGKRPSELHSEVSGDEIRALRERANLSQAVFARHLHLSPGYISQLERGTKRPTGAVLALLNIIRRKGIEILF